MFGEHVREHRQRLSLSQLDLATKAGIDPKTLRSIETGRRTPRPSTVRQLADAFGLAGSQRERFCAAVADIEPPVTAQPEGVPPEQLRPERAQPDRDTAPAGLDVAPRWAAGDVVPAQLPPDPPCFTGRRRELDQLDRLLGGSPAVLISAITGTPGVGKTALAVHWARLVADRFPDGQLYVNLRGFDPDGHVMTQGEAVRALLDALGVPPSRVPAYLDARIGLYRSVLAGRRILVMLDNARDAAQIRPLLPGTPTARVLVTSRDLLVPLVAMDGAEPMRLTVMSTVEARSMLARRLGEERVADEPDAVDAIVAGCARLPLALAIAAGRAHQTGLSLGDLAIDLRDAGQRLDALDAGDGSSRIRAVFSWSYAELNPAAARLFRLLGLQPGADCSIAAAASLAGEPLSTTRRLLGELVRANLLTEHQPGRYHWHDLLRAYAADLVSHDSEATRNAALRRLFDHYTHTAHAAERVVCPYRDPMPLHLDEPDSGAVVEPFDDDRAATAWLAAEHQVLLAALRHAAATGFDRWAWQLVWALDTYLTRRGDRQDLVYAWQVALDAAARFGEPCARAYAHRALAVASIEVERFDDAREHAEHALALYAAAGNDAGQGHTHRDLAYLRWRRGDAQGALQHAEQGLALFRAAGHQRGIANELNGVGWYHAELGNYAAALTYCGQALDLLQQLGDEVGAAQTWDSLGYAHHHLGNHREAVACYRRALALHRRLGDRHDQADTLNRLGDTCDAAGSPEAARTAWLAALDIFTDLDHPDAAGVRAKLP